MTNKLLRSAESTNWMSEITDKQVDIYHYNVCMYVRTYVCMYVRTYVCMSVCMYVRTYVRMY